jgi:hypothetical protein
VNRFAVVQMRLATMVFKQPGEIHSHTAKKM